MLTACGRRASKLAAKRLRFSIKGLELLEIRESAEAIEVVSEAPGFCRPVFAILLVALASALMPTWMGYPIPTSFRDLTGAGFFHVVGLAGAIGALLLAARAAYASGRLRLDARSASLLEHRVFGYARYECPLSELELLGVDYEGSEDGGFTLWPMHYLALRFGENVRTAMYGHSEQALLEVCRRLLLWMKARKPAT